MSPHLKYPLLVAGVAALSFGCGLLGGVVGSAYHPGPRGEQGQQGPVGIPGARGPAGLPAAPLEMSGYGCYTQQYSPTYDRSGNLLCFLGRPLR